MSAAIIVRAVAGQSPILAKIHARAFAQGWSEDSIESLLAPPGIGYLALLSGTPSGLVLARRAADEAEILTIAVLPEARRLGLGRALIAAAAREASRCGCARMFLEVAADNAAARALYEELGFRRVGERKNYYRPIGAQPADAMVLSARLPLDIVGN